MNRISSFLSRSGALRTASRQYTTFATQNSRNLNNITRQLEAAASLAASHKLGLFIAASVFGASVTVANLNNTAICESAPAPVDFTKLYDAIAATLEDENYDDGSYGPVYVRLAWHAAGTYDKNHKDGGSTGGTIRFSPEANHGGNAGLQFARERLESVKAAFPGITYADLYTFAGVVAIQEMAGPQIAWRAGRPDAKDGSECTPDGRLPDGGQGASHVRDVFGRMGFTEREMVALIGGGHSIGRCHSDRSGFDGPWTFSPTTFSNNFFTLLLDEQWVDRKTVDPNWKGPAQYTNATGGEKNKLMMLPADYAFKTDSEFKKWAEFYKTNPEALSEDFAKAFAKLLELGVKFPETAKPAFFKGSE